MYEVFTVQSDEVSQVICDLVMDVSKVKFWKELKVCVVDRDNWRESVRRMRQPTVNVKLGNHVLEGGTELLL